MSGYDKNKSVRYAVITSVALHLGLFVLAMPLWRLPPAQKASEKLALELYGMLAEPPAPAQPRPIKADQAGKTPEQIPHPKEPVTAVARNQDLSPVAQAVSPPDVSAATDAGVAPKKPDDETSVKTSSTANPNADELRRYLVKIKKKFQSNLVYPEEAKKEGYEGTPVIKFTITESGNIRSNTLTIAHSSGYAVLDANAIKTAMLSAPFDHPSREMEIAIPVSFEVDR
ncbi:energy transducer TonB [Uliginosibacterium gangwonense]|uniref:energy transducer TonB n=1 Tax=Uliginosibacterium gangwonense TaxID=392736 RepID=UPI00037CDC2D|nr:TonB family protein [Uliginosibacterium gangwonense]